MQGLFGGHLLGRGAERPVSGEDVEPEVAAAFGPFVVLLGQDGADEADEIGEPYARAIANSAHRTTPPLPALAVQVAAVQIVDDDNREVFYD